MKAKIAILAATVVMIAAPMYSQDAKARRPMTAAEQKSKQTRIRERRQAREDASSREHDMRIAREQRAERTKAPLATGPYVSLGLAQGASAQTVLGLDGKHLSRGSVLSAWRHKVEPYSTDKFKYRTEQEQAQARQVWLLLDKSKRELYKQLR